jgi:hypothetical protein
VGAVADDGGAGGPLAAVAVVEVLDHLLAQLMRQAGGDAGRRPGGPAPGHRRLDPAGQGLLRCPAGLHDLVGVLVAQLVSEKPRQTARISRLLASASGWLANSRAIAAGGTIARAQPAAAASVASRLMLALPLADCMRLRDSRAVSQP